MRNKVEPPSSPPRQKPAAARRERELRARIEQESRERTQRRMIIAGIGGVIAVAIIVLFFVFRDDGPGPVKAGLPIDSSVPTSGLTLGSSSAPVTLVEYADFQSAASAEMYQNALPALIQDYIATGKVSLQFMPYAILGDESTAAAEAALCANDQNQFWQMHNALFANQNGENSGAFSTKRLEQIAAKLGLDMDAFDSCLETSAHAGDVQNYHATAQQDGITSAPTFVINNGEPFGWDSWASLEEAIDSALGS